MDVKEVAKEISQIDIFKNVNFNVGNDTNRFGTIKVEPKQFKDSGKNEYILGNAYNIFIAHMYEGEKDKEFFYVLIYRQSKRRNYRAKTFHDIEYNKIYASGKTVELIINNLKNQLTDYTLL